MTENSLTENSLAENSLAENSPAEPLFVSPGSEDRDDAEPEDGAETDVFSAGFEALLEQIKLGRGFDFTGYKRASLMRRVDKRMETVGITAYSDYQDFLEVHPDEFEHLFDTILINVTAFFRDGAAWQNLSKEIIPRLLKSKAFDEPIRIWSAGCAGGQEPYSLAMALAEALGPEDFRQRVKIYATDVDEQALAQARAGIYSASEIQSVPLPLRDKYFEREKDKYVFHRDLRRVMIFGRHDLVQDAPISRIDLLACRNTIMYFNAEVQARIINRFHFAVADSGFLFLGKAEMLFSHASLFTPADLKRRVFQKISAAGLRPRDGSVSVPGFGLLNDPVPLREMLFQQGPTAQIVVDAAGRLIMCNAPSRKLFGLTDLDLGRPLQDLELSYRPVELRSCIDRAYAELRAVAVQGVAFSPQPGETIFLDTLVTPLLESGQPLGAGISFTDVTRVRQLSEELQAASRELETAYEELQSTVEELETTNEELQSTVEELETTNEELQSTNEELETTNEELQSTNEELQTINEELRLRSAELDQVNLFLKSILVSLRGGVIVLDAELRVQFWNEKSENFWGLRAEETRNRPLLTLDIGLPITALLPAIQLCLAQRGGREEVTVDAINRRGKPMRCRVVVTTLVDPDASRTVQGVLLQIEEDAAEE